MTRGAAIWLLLLALVACGPSSPLATPGAVATTAAPALPATTIAAPLSAPADAKPALVTSPAVNLTVGVAPNSVFGPHYIAQARGYFQEVGLNVEFFSTPGPSEQLPALIQGQIQVGGCASNIGCFNALNRRADVQIVADLQSGGKTPKSTGNIALVVRKDLWDSGAIREAKDLVGRTVYTSGGQGGAPYIEIVHWLERQGLDPRSVEFSVMSFPDVLAAMGNRGIELGIQVEPLLSAGVARGAYEVLATQEEMYPDIEALYVLYWTGIERLGPQVGERFMVAYLRGVRDYLNAFEYGIDLDAVIQVLTENTPIKDPDVYRQMRYTWIDPNGLVNRGSLEADAQLLRDFGIAQTPIDLSPMFEDKYRRFAVQYLGEYQPPR